jgi:hypothetical protein
MCGVFRYAVNSSNCIVSNGRILKNEKLVLIRRKSDLRFGAYPGICLEGLTKAGKNLRIRALHAEV